MNKKGAILRAFSLCGALAISAPAEEPMVAGLLPVVVTDDVNRLKIFYRDVVGEALGRSRGVFPGPGREPGRRSRLEPLTHHAVRS